MNFNSTAQPEYSLYTDMTDELINLYGIEIKYLIAEKINNDDLIFGDYSHLKTDSSKSFKISALPENSDTWDNTGINFSQFGLVNLDNISLFVSKKTVLGIYPDIESSRGFEGIIGNLIVLPNNKIMEITDIQFEVPGVNNLFVNSDQKSVYKFSCKPYDFKLINEIDTDNNTNISIDDSSEYNTLDNYFSELIDKKDELENSTEINSSEITYNNIDKVKTNKPLIDKTETNVFGEFN